MGGRSSLQHGLRKFVQVTGLDDPGRVPAWVLGVVLGLIGLMYLLPETGVDMLVTYGPAGRGELYIEGVNPRNPRFALWLFWVLSRLPWKWDYLFLMVISVPLLAWAVRWLGGSYWKLFLSFPFLWLIAYGQIDAFIVFGLALSWWSLKQEQYWWMGAGLALLCFLKPQLGIVLALYLWLWSPQKWQPLAIPAALGLISMLQWGWDWPLRWLQAALAETGNLEANWVNGSLFPVMGYWAFFVWIPAIVLPMKRRARLRAIIAAMALSLPYFPAYELLLLLVLPVSVFEWLLAGISFLGHYSLAWILPAWALGYEVWQASLGRPGAVRMEN